MLGWLCHFGLCTVLGNVEGGAIHFVAWQQRERAHPSKPAPVTSASSPLLPRLSLPPMRAPPAGDQVLSHLCLWEPHLIQTTTTLQLACLSSWGMEAGGTDDRILFILSVIAGCLRCNITITYYFIIHVEIYMHTTTESFIHSFLYSWKEH